MEEKDEDLEHLNEQVISTKMQNDRLTQENHQLRDDLGKFT